MDCGVLQFEDIEIDLEQYELRLSHRVIGLERQPVEVLILLAERSGHLVTREEIVARLWDKNTFLDTDQSINSAIRKIRAALKDDPERPRYVLTVVGKGYRFIAPVKPGSGLSNRETPIPSGSEQYAPPTAGSNSGRNSLFLASAVALSLVAGLLFF